MRTYLSKNSITKDYEYKVRMKSFQRFIVTIIATILTSGFLLLLVFIMFMSKW